MSFAIMEYEIAESIRVHSCSYKISLRFILLSFSALMIRFSLWYSHAVSNLRYPAISASPIV